ncbi:hypothetical protein UAJ10_09235 [Nitrospirillum sp. BR 11164]|uniref:hypothetical protein n=1 Tax=Nitrospirillum sp. BR 11164 TaxID=3104324 RepID=UPI002AFE6471|nr:hypothetical protein [Nitrospirillum sp. BR 11164]MEA1649200.1 hypothetical protein [Nitrospirillum sp. BR 11164]
MTRSEVLGTEDIEDDFPEAFLDTIGRWFAKRMIDEVRPNGIPKLRLISLKEAGALVANFLGEKRVHVALAQNLIETSLLKGEILCTADSLSIWEDGRSSPYGTWNGLDEVSQFGLDLNSLPGYPYENTLGLDRTDSIKIFWGAPNINQDPARAKRIFTSDLGFGRKNYIMLAENLKVTVQDIILKFIESSPMAERELDRLDIEQPYEHVADDDYQRIRGGGQNREDVNDFWKEIIRRLGEMSQNSFNEQKFFDDMYNWTVEGNKKIGETMIQPRIKYALHMTGYAVKAKTPTTSHLSPFDIFWAEVAKRKINGEYPLYDGVSGDEIARALAEWVAKTRHKNNPLPIGTNWIKAQLQLE